ncbi:mitochondrial import inner membrane translocase subunit TIM50 [Plasmodium gonderi]|uniref:Mitochondrial import inner membrane translocase subunit TIM50 n=1 Tax=Plasmodium gonderi TaxID=77519 RepID=A0A1Y1JFD3_PLAGO|nr:mitochondrial import inner membrane translocase subunit TIM50 [Plasmodium gonderi]GAW79153.1 mitochondrial import inner membrane translocase subunit TIM50 [Plasmodium gonderi]
MIASLCLSNLKNNEKKLFHYLSIRCSNSNAGINLAAHKKKKNAEKVTKFSKHTEIKYNNNGRITYQKKKFTSISSLLDKNENGRKVCKNDYFKLMSNIMSPIFVSRNYLKGEDKLEEKKKKKKSVNINSTIKSPIIQFNRDCSIPQFSKLFYMDSRSCCYMKRTFVTSKSANCGNFKEEVKIKMNKVHEVNNRGEVNESSNGGENECTNHSSVAQTSKTFNSCKSDETLNSNKSKKTLRQIYLHKKEREKMIKMYLLLSLLLMPFGQVYMYCIENDISMEELLKMLKEKAEVLENKYNDLLNEFIDKYFPLSNEPLLPDFKDLNYPENLPTLVIDLNYVIAKLEYDRKTGWRVLKRPYADMFFKELSSFYEIVIWSDDNFPVAQEVISKWGIPAIGCLHRDQCSKKKRHYVKDLNRLGRNLDRVVIIDHDAHAFMLQPENGILIKEFNGDVNDKEIFCLIDLLKSFAISTYDISHFLKKYGGGDYNIGKRYMQLKSDTEQKSQRIRSFGKIFHLDSKKTPNGISFNS